VPTPRRLRGIEDGLDRWRPYAVSSLITVFKRIKHEQTALAVPLDARALVCLALRTQLVAAECRLQRLAESASLWALR
jgi:hypothetical protein